MTDLFHTKIRESIAKPNLQSALDLNTQKRLAVRTQAIASLADYPQLRQRAHAMREEVITHLERYLAQFVEQVEAHGIQVHRAKDAAQAVQIVLNIAHQNNAQLIAKSKTMVSEEMELNHALEAAGLRVVETDLGEYIVQLRGEKPSHIITPAVHLRRAEVGQVFHEKLGIPLTEDIPVLTNAARHALREVFLNADIGISGVNFGVAESGTLAVLTNEGNGRMVTTLPPVHIALMGIERLVPTLDDLGLMISLLPRSATGQKITVYVSLINRPRQEGEVDGPLQRHLVLVDNGRNALRRTPLEESLYCIRCGACLNACPVFREIGGHGYVGSHGESTPYSGPIGSIISPALFGQAEFSQLARASSLCGACKEACPVDIDLPKMLLRVRAGGKHIETQRIPAQVPWYLAWGLRFYTWAATSPGRFHLAQKAAGFFSRLLAPVSPWLRLPAFTGWGYSKDMARPSSRPFRDRYQPHVSGKPYAAPVPRPLEPATVTEQVLPAQDRQSLLRRFERELIALDGKFVLCTQADLAKKISSLLEARGVNEILAWNAGLPGELVNALGEAGVKVHFSPDPVLRAGLTGALAGIADTATLVLPGGPQKPLSVSLLPEIHLAVLKASDIHLSLPEVLQKPEIRQAAAVALVSGPSRTADIEMTLTLGVHGPGEVYVFCVLED